MLVTAVCPMVPVCWDPISAPWPELPARERLPRDFPTLKNVLIYHKNSERPGYEDKLSLVFLPPGLPRVRMTFSSLIKAAVTN